MRLGEYRASDRRGVEHVIERRVDPKQSVEDLLPPGTLPRWGGITVGRLNAEQMDRELERRTPPHMLDQFDRVLARASELHKSGLAEAPMADTHGWRRQLILCWHHSLDVATTCLALGHFRNVSGLHDLAEFVPAGRIQAQAGPRSRWYEDFLNGLDPTEPVGVGFLNANFCSSLCRWGEAKTGTQNAMDAHRLSCHHDGCPETPQEWIERSVNFVFHHLPRESYGIRHEPLCDWSALDERLAEDPAMKDDPIGHEIIEDARVIMPKLEEHGYLVPWHLLIDDESPPLVTIEHAHAVLGEARRTLTRQAERAEAKFNRDRAGVTSDTVERVGNLIDAAAAPTRNRASDESLGDAFERLIRSHGSTDTIVLESAGEAIAARLAMQTTKAGLDAVRQLRISTQIAHHSGTRLELPDSESRLERLIEWAQSTDDRSSQAGNGAWGERVRGWSHSAEVLGDG